MDYAYSPHRDGGGTLHLPSPTHVHSYHDNLAAINKLRRSLSRSPSKSRFQFAAAKTPSASPGSPLSPLALAHSFTPSSCSPNSENVKSSIFAAPAVDQGTPTAAKKKFTLRRTTGFRSSPRINATPRSPMRRALSETSNMGNVSSNTSRRCSQEDQPELAKSARRASNPKQPSLRLDVDSGPIRFDFGQPRVRADTLMVATDLDVSAKSSPLKRDVDMNMDGVGSPNPKRRSIHAAMFGSDSDFFSHATFSMEQPRSSSASQESNPFASPAPKRPSETPARKVPSLRKSTLQQRQVQTSLRPRPSVEIFNDGPQSSPMPQARSRMSLDSSLFTVPSPSPLNRSAPVGSSNPLPPRPVFVKPAAPTTQPHPLSFAHTPSSSSSVGSSLFGQQASSNNSSKPSIFESRPTRPLFTRSLPLGVTRPSCSAQSSQQSDASSFATPETYKMAKPLPAAFMSTGLISKRNRDVDFAGSEQYSTYAMPDTPSKRASFPPVTASPFPKSVVRPRAQPEFGRTSALFGTPAAASKGSPITFGRGSNIFGVDLSDRGLSRRGSFVSIDGEESTNSPITQHDSQSSADELPPTPTKPGGKPKESSLRSSLFGRRTSIGPDTFVPPHAIDVPSPKGDRKGKCPDEFPTIATEQNDGCIQLSTIPETVAPFPVKAPSIPLLQQEGVSFSYASTILLDSTPRQNYPHISPASAKQLRTFTATPTGQEHNGRISPHTPSESFVPPDPSSLTISGGCRDPQPTFRTSTMSNASFPPATPTASRDHHVFPFGPAALPVGGVVQTDVDTSLKSRFGIVTTYGVGEFSIVYRVEKPLNSLLNFGSPTTSTTAPRVWAVKKDKKPYAGNRDRERKLREVEILQALRNNDHVINYIDHWESRNHLYIQTEFCEDGNLKDFLARTGYKGRLDDFRIWKVLLELSSGVKFIHDSGFIHLDLKPANVFIDFEGVLKIGDFGLATRWPASPTFEGEGDREYIGPEVLHGRFDKPADIFALGMIMLEIAGNIVLPDNGASWQRLRQGDLSDLPSLTWSSESSLTRNESGEPIARSFMESSFLASSDDDDIDATPLSAHVRLGELAVPPNFMIDPEDPEALDRMVQWMISPEPGRRPRIEDLVNCQGVRWVGERRRSGATIYEGNWGPSDGVLAPTSEEIANAFESSCQNEEDVDMMDV